MKIAIQGTHGSFHHQASELFFGADHEIAPCETFTQVFEAVEAGAVQRGLIACENSLYGSINDTYDLLLKHRPHIIGEIYLHVRLQLLAKSDIDPGDITDVYSQAPALAETKQFIRNKMPLATVHEYPDTAMSARFVAKSNNKTAASIASAKAAELYNLSIIEQDIEDHPHNYTRFFAITKHPTPIVEADKSTHILKTNDSPGALHRALGAFANESLNLSKLESRPVVDDSSWRYIFYVDIEASMSDERVKKAFKALDADGCEYITLGSYKKATLPNGLR